MRKWKKRENYAYLGGNFHLFLSFSVVNIQRSAETS